jgi:hypothetical protein
MSMALAAFSAASSLAGIFAKTLRRFCPSRSMSCAIAGRLYFSDGVTPLARYQKLGSPLGR